MKFNCGLTWQEKMAATEKWHKFFLWWPKNFGSRNCRWLETVWRKGEFRCVLGRGWWHWEYSIEKPLEVVK